MFLISVIVIFISLLLFGFTMRVIVSCYVRYEILSIFMLDWCLFCKVTTGFKTQMKILVELQTGKQLIAFIDIWKCEVKSCRELNR